MKSIHSKSLISLSLVALSFSLISCNSGSVSSKEKEIHQDHVSLRFWYDETSQTNDILGFAHLWYQGETLGSAFKNVVEPHNLVAGDVLNFSFTGEYADSIMVIPGVLDIWGEVIDYEYTKTFVEKVTIESGTLIDTLNNSYEIEDPYVILNKQGAYTSLEKYQGDKLYVSLDYEKMYINIDRNDSRQYGPSRKIAAALYAYQPR